MIRTRDLTLTKGALYRWSYGSISIDALDLHEIARRLQAGFSASTFFVCKQCVRTTKQVKRIGCSTLKDLIEDQKIIIEDFDIIEELSNFISKRESYEADEGHHDDLVMCLVLFGWLIRQEYFKDLTNSDIRQKFLADKEEMLDEEMLPFGFYDDGQDNTPKVEQVDHYSLEDLREFFS